MAKKVVKKTVSKLLKIVKHKESVKHKKRKKPVSPPAKKKTFVDEELLKTLESRGLKRKPIEAPQVPKKPQVKPRPMIQVKSQATPQIIKQKEIDVKEKLGVEEEQIKSAESLPEKKVSIFAKFANLFKKKGTITTPLIKDEEKEPVIVNKPKEVIEDIKEELKPVSVPEFRTEIKTDYKPQPKPESDNVKDTVPDSEAFPITKADAESKPPTVVVPGEEPEKKQGFFARLFFPKKKEDAEYELEAITLSPTPKDDMRHMTDASSSYISNPYPTKKESVASALKDQIMPQKNVQEKEDGNVAKVSDTESSSMGMMMGEKKKSHLK